MGKNGKSKRKKKGKKWVEKKNRSNKKGEKKRKTKETPMYIKGKPICFHMFRRPKVCWIFLGSTSTWYTPICLPERTFRTHVPVEKGFPQQTFESVHSIPQEDSKQLASAQGCRRLALQHRVSSKRALRHPAGTLREVARRFGRSPLVCPKLGNWFGHGYPIFRERALYKNHQTSSIKWGAI